MTNEAKQTGLIAYFANNAVAANLLMIFIAIMGAVTYFSLPRQMFPSIEVNFISIQANYPGASPQEIEESILIKIDEALKDVTEIKRSVSRAYRNSGRVSLEIDPDEQLSDVLDKVKLRVDGIATFPAGMEPVTVYQEEFNQDVIEMAIVGDSSLKDLKPLAKDIENELLQLSNVSLVDLYAPDDEIAVEIQPDQLRKYNITLDDIRLAIQRFSANYSAGQLRTDTGIISVRVENQFYKGDEFRRIPIKIGNNGAQVLLEDVAIIQDGFTEGERYFSFSGQNAIYMSVKATKDQNMIPVAESVKAYVKERNKSLPEGLELKILVDMTKYVTERLNMMLSNLFQGSILVAFMLTLFLRFRLALWVMIGLPVCFLGAILTMGMFGISINVLSLFAFIMVLGIVVDDAIVIGESAYTEIEKHGGGVENVVRGTMRVATPATFGVLTTIAVFVPFTQGSGFLGTMMWNIAGVAIFCLAFSLVESKLILPAHLAHTNFKPVKAGSWRDRFNSRFFGFINGPYRNFIEVSTRFRWAVFGTFIALLLTSVGLISGNFVRMVPSPSVPHDFPSIRIEMNETVSDTATIEALKLIEKVVQKVENDVIDEYGSGLVRDTLSFNDGRTEGQILVALVPEEQRPFDTFELARRWRAEIPEIPGMKSFTIRDDPFAEGGGDGDFGYLLFGPDIETLNAAGRKFIELLQQEKGLFDISSTIDPASKEIQMTLLPVAYDLGLDLSSIANQVGASFYGGEAQRVIRNGEEVRVMVRYPRLTRERFAELKYAVITTPSGKEVMLGDVVSLEEMPGISYIRREGGYRSVYVYGNIDEEAVEPNAVVERIAENLLPEMQKFFPSVKTELGGAIEETQAQQNEQILFFIAGLIMMYILLAVPLKSYMQPFMILMVIPFSFTGAIWGHFFFGVDLSTMSTFGLIAAAGVVINDSLLMTDFINSRRKEGIHIKQAVLDAGCARFRAITLTSITTFVGVLPIMFETSMQARMVVPMAIALGFAVIYATIVTLVLIPSMYLILEDIRLPFRWIKARLSKSEPTPQQSTP
ncbi:efflux RND transporter permease subunit [Aliiglaciecola sp. NS0011-25]|uniref:efflux RND transporter permease subunit n=1 Tax=Aliiglaciecola sp. NS0011-25 TaxID=3127654 RepID=UPI00310A38E6